MKKTIFLCFASGLLAFVFFFSAADYAKSETDVSTSCSALGGLCYDPNTGQECKGTVHEARPGYVEDCANGSFCCVGSIVKITVTEKTQPAKENSDYAPGSNSYDENAVLEQCKKYHNPADCVTMPRYLSAMASECRRIKPAGIDCEKIEEEGFSGKAASAFSKFESENDTNYAPGPNSTTSKSNSGFLLPTEFGLPDATGGIKTILENILNWFLGIIGIIAIISLMISGFQYFFAAGDERTMETAKRNILYSIVGIIVVLSAFVIIKAIDAALNAVHIF